MCYTSLHVQAVHGPEAWYHTWFCPVLKQPLNSTCHARKSHNAFSVYIVCFKRLSPIHDLSNIARREYWLSFFQYYFPACSQGLYKAGLRNTQCQNCPPNSTVVGAVTCNCTRGHYRMHGEGAAVPCTSKLLSTLFVFEIGFSQQCIANNILYIMNWTF